MIGTLVLASALQPLPLGRSSTTFDIEGTPIEVYLYRPRIVERVILVMHGTLRNAEDYRDDSESMGDRFRALIVAPRFDAQRFPSIRYQRGGLVLPSGVAAKPQEWTYAFIPKLASQVSRLLPNPTKYWIIGHSAGGQFVGRMSAFQRTGAERMVAANAGSHIFPSMDAPFGYGFGSLPAELANEARLKSYLAAPLTFYQGTGDDHPDEYFDESAEAMKQGKSRLERGRACFESGRQLALRRGWKFGWRYVEAVGVPHDHTRMFNHSKCSIALFGVPESAFDLNR